MPTHSALVLDGRKGMYCVRTSASTITKCPLFQTGLDYKNWPIKKAKNCEKYCEYMFTNTHTHTQATVMAAAVFCSMAAAM